MAAPKLRCVTCGGPAFDCRCWEVQAYEAEADRCVAQLRRNDLTRKGRSVWEKQRQTAVRMRNAAVAAGGLFAPLVAMAQAFPECPASASCVLLLMPSAFVLSAEDGFILGAAITVIWAAAYGFRMAIRALNVADAPGASD